MHYSPCYLFLFLIVLFLASCEEESGGLTGPEPTPAPVPEPEPASLSQGLVVLLPFSGTADATVGDSITATVAGAVAVPGRDGKPNEAYSFDGIDDYIAYGAQPVLAYGEQAPFTVAGWVKADGPPAASFMAIASIFNGGYTAAWSLGVLPDGRVIAHRETAPWAVTGSSSVLGNDFVHVARVYDGTNLAIYVNGMLEEQVAFGSVRTDTRTPLIVGAAFDRDVRSFFFNGIIDELRVYDRALTTDELTYLATH